MAGGKTSDERAYLEYRAQDGEGTAIQVDEMPFTIGRDPTASFVIYSRQISKFHVRLFQRGGDYVVRDLESRNGTFVNGEALTGECVLNPGDILHIATKEFRFGIGLEADDEDHTLASDPDMQVLAVRGARELSELLAQRGVRSVFQGVVRFPSREIMGYEVLSRSSMPQLDVSVFRLFELASKHGLAADLSRMMREVALEHVARLPGEGMKVFVNLHPAELASDALFESLIHIPEALGSGKQGIVEFPETAVTDPAAMRKFHAVVKDLGLGLAYDDFGAGQSRLMELAEAPPDLIKLDMSLIRGIHLSSPRRELVAALVKVMIDLGVEVLAEGVETEDEWQACEDLGCHLAQGFLTHRPASIDELRVSAGDDSPSGVQTPRAETEIAPKEPPAAGE